MDTKTADSTTRPKNFYQKAKTFDRCPKNMEKKRKLLNIFFLIMCLWLHKMKFWPSCKSVFVKIRKNLAQVRKWLENQNFNSMIVPKNFRRHSKNQFFQLRWKAFARRRQLFCSMSKKWLQNENFVFKKCIPLKCFHGHRKSSFDNFAGKLSTTGGFFFAEFPENTKEIFNVKLFCLKKFLRTGSKLFWRPCWET